MSLERDFSKAQRQVKQLKTRPKDDMLLKLYSLYKQATLGDTTGRLPIAKGLVAVAKWKAWKKHNGMTVDEAKRKYILLVADLFEEGGREAEQLSETSDKAATISGVGRVSSWKGLTVLVTGASRGIGKAIAIRLGQEGANLILCGRSMEEGEIPGSLLTTKKEVEANGGKALCIKVNVRNVKEIEAAVKYGAEHFGSIDALACNAGALFIAPFEDTPMKRFDLVHEVNIRATFALCHAALPHLKQSSNGRIMVLSPPISLQPKWLSGTLAYTISKYSMSMLVLGLAEELADYGIAVNSMWPATTIDTAAVRLNKALGGDEMAQRSRKPIICADAAFELLSRPADHTGFFHTDESILREVGEENFDKYAVDATKSLQIDYYL